MKLAKRCQTVLTLGVVLSMVTPQVFGATKNETVFVTCDAKGQTEKVIVSNHLEINEEIEVKDISKLENITNLKGDEVPEQKGDNLLWKTVGKYIYYQGTTTKKTPVETSIKYELDGKQISAQELAGKTGHLKMIIKQVNTEKQMKMIDGKEKQLYVPFYSMATVIFDVDVMQNIKIKNGNLVSDGARKTIVGVMLPGMKENLGNSGVDFISDTIEIEGDVEDFHLEPIYITTSATLPRMDEMSEIDETEAVSAMVGSIDDLSKASNKLVDGSRELKSGMTMFDTKLGEFSVGVKQVIGGVNKFTSGVGQLDGGIGKLNSSISTMSDSVKAYETKGKELVVGSDTQLEAIGTLHSSLDQIIATLPDDLPQKALLTELSGGMGQLEKSSSVLNEGINSYVLGAGEIVAGVSMLKTGGLALQEGTAEILKAVTPLKSGLAQVGSGVDALVSASNDLSKGTVSLEEGVNKFNEEGIKRLQSSINEKLGELDAFTEVKDVLYEMANEYDSFTGNDPINESRVAFVTKITGVN